MLAISPRLGNPYSRLAISSPVYNGMPLAAAFMIAWPYNRVKAKFECRKMEKLPFTWLYVLRAIDAGITGGSAISEFLGMPEQSVGLWLSQLQGRNALTFQSGTNWELTGLGREFLDSPDIEKVVTLPARIVWDCIRGRVSDILYDDLRVRDKRPETAIGLQPKDRIPASRNLPLPQCQQYLEYYLDELGEAYDGAELLHLDYSTKPTSAHRRIYVLLYGISSEKYEVRVWDNDSYDNESAGLVRACPLFGEKIQRMFSDDHVIDFLRRANVKNYESFRKLRFHPSVLSALSASKDVSDDKEIKNPENFRTLPAQGVSFLEKALTECRAAVRIVVTDTQILEWEVLKEQLGRALARGSKCEIVISNYSASRAEHINRVKEMLTKAAVAYVPQPERSAARRMLSIVPKDTRYASHWVSTVICDDKWVWCGSDMVPGAGAAQAHFGFYSESKTIVENIAISISRQLLGNDEQLYPEVKVTTKKARIVGNKKPEAN